LVSLYYEEIVVIEELEDDFVAAPSLRSLIEIEVSQLFGIFTYRLHANDESNKLVILYGDNGAGKTTLLECVYHLLSPDMNSGHRGYLSRIQFQRFSIKFSGGWKLIAERSAPATGDYSLSCFDPSRNELLELNFIAEEKNFGEGRSSEYASYLRRLNLEIYFLRADRTLQSDSPAQVRRSERNHVVHRDAFRILESQMRNSEDERDSLERAIRRTNDYIRRKSSRAADSGGKSANSIYDEVVKKISDQSRPVDVSRSSLEERLISLDLRTREFAKFSLMPPLEVKDTLKSVAEASPENLRLIANVLQPHLDGINARLDALDSTQRLVASLVEDLNSFFTNKRIRFSLTAGIQIIATGGMRLSPAQLSSGERHLLLMFCHTVVAHGRRTLFIIDEPELSLNVKWQHKIVDRLLDVVRDSPMQFIFATHSIELLSQHLDSVVQLSNVYIADSESKPT
jgi:energy-coupling factor transporter ATP-binding protein EcfA2